MEKQMDELAERLENERRQALKEPSEKNVLEFRVRWLGRKGLVTELMTTLRDAPPEKRPILGKSIHELRQKVEAVITELLTLSTRYEIEQSLGRPPLDITLPIGAAQNPGSLHPVTLMGQRVMAFFRRYGFTVYDGPELEFDFYNFSALNVPTGHPARDMQDTFFAEGRQDVVLRTQTSNLQIHAMLNEPPPLRVIAPGRVYRVDNDATHTPMFHQVEAVVVDAGISFAHLKGMIQAFTQAIFAADLKTRFRPSYFPFVEPGAEVDMACVFCRGQGCRTCKNSGWIEIGGCGLIHPNVFEAVHYDSEIYSGYAFGFGLDRMAMLAYGLNDLRQMFEGDSRYQRRFPVYP